VLGHFIKRHAAFQASTPHAAIDRPKHSVLWVRPVVHDSTDQPVEVGLVCDQRLTPEAESACLTQQDYTNIFNVNHQRKLPNVRLRLASRTFRESGVGIWTSR